MMATLLGGRLIEAGLASAEAIEQALAHQRITGHRLGDCLYELGLVAEAPLLRFLATEFKTRYVSADKLSKANIGPEVLAKIPVRMAEAQCLLPVALDPESRSLSVLMAEPQNGDLVREIALITEMSEIVPFVGVRAVIQAGIKKHYYGDPTAFAALATGDSAVLRSRSANTLREAEVSRIGPAESLARGSSSGASGRTSSRISGAQGRDLLLLRGAVSESDYLETLNTLVSLLEQPRSEFRNHSAQVARQSAFIARRMGLPPRDISHVQLAAYLHDLGKKPDVHLTLLALDSDSSLKPEAKQLVRAPLKLFEAVHLPAQVNSILAQLYEAFDGSGVPFGAKGEDIPPGSRIIAAVDSFFDLTRNPFNPAGRVLSKQEAVEALSSAAGRLFDPTIIQLLSTLQSGDVLRQRVVTDGRQVVVADPDAGTANLLVEALARLGVVAQSVAKLDSLIDALLNGEADTIAVSLGYGVSDLSALTQFVRARAESASIPVIVWGEPTDAASKERLLQAGVTSFAASTPEVASLIQRAAGDYFENGGPGRVVHGNFAELSGLDVAQILGSHRKTGRLLIRQGPTEGALQLEQGRVLHAVFSNLAGEPAVRELLALAQAEFQYDSNWVLSDMPNADTDLELLAHSVAGQSALIPR